MTKSLLVRLNHDCLHDIQTTASFEAEDSFSLVLQNGDAPVHVHLHLDDALSSVASLPANNHFLDANSTHQVSVDVADGADPVEGRLKIVTGHGAETDHVNVTITEPVDEEDAVDVDATLAKPERSEESDGGGVQLDASSLEGNGPILALAVFAFAVAVTSATLSDSPSVLVGSLAVIASIGAAVYMLIR